MAYIGNSVENQGFAPAIDYFNGDGTTVTFTLSRPVVSVAQMIVAIDNVVQNPSSAFTVTDNSITFTSAPLSGTNNIWVEYTSLITQYNAISQDPSVIGDITASGGFLSTGDFGNTFTDGAIVDYVTGNARITTGPVDGLTIYNGGPTARVSLAAWDSSGNLINTGGAVIQGLTVGKGGGSVSTNTAVGVNALTVNTTAVGNTAIGYNAGSNNTGTNITAVGRSALSANTTGNNNTAVGYAASILNTTGASNASFGHSALYNNTTGSYNVAVGQSALQTNTTASNNTAVGYQAGYSNVTGARNTFLGLTAGYSSTSNDNTFIGFQSGYSSTGSGNCFVGSYATSTGTGSGQVMTTGTKNTILGSYSGNQGGLDIRTASNYIVLSDGDGNPRGHFANGAGFVMQGTNNEANPYIASWDSSLYAYGRRSSGSGVYLANNATSWASTSDERRKDIIEPISDAINKVSKLRAVIGKYKIDEEGTRRSFLIAQDVQAVLPEAVNTQTDENGEFLGMSYTDVIPLLVAAIKELKAEVDALKGAK